MSKSYDQICNSPIIRPGVMNEKANGVLEIVNNHGNSLSWGVPLALTLRKFYRLKFIPLDWTSSSSTLSIPK